MTRILRRIPLTLLAAVVLLMACESPTSSLTESGIQASIDFGDVLADELEMSSDQRQDVQDEIRRHDTPEVNPGSLWFIATRLQASLDEEQKARLFRLAQAEQSKHFLKLVGVYSPCGDPGPIGVEHPSRVPIGLLADLLTDEQLARAAEIRQRYHERLQTLQEQHRRGALTREEYAAALEALYGAMEAAIYDLLTEDQIAMLKRRLAAQNSDTHSQTKHGKRAMIEALGLSERQVAAIDDLHEGQCTILQRLIRQARENEITRPEFQRSLMRLVDAKTTALGRILDRRQFEAAKIHDALLVIHVRRYLQHLAGDESGRG